MVQTSDSSRQAQIRRALCCCRGTERNFFAALKAAISAVIVVCLETGPLISIIKPKVLVISHLHSGAFG